METFGRNQQFSKDIHKTYQCIWIFFSQSGLTIFKVQFINFINQFIKRNLFFFAKRMDMSPMLSHHSVGHGS